MNFDSQILEILAKVKGSRSLILIFGFIMIPFIGIIDYITGYEMAFSIFYMLPITLITLATGFKLGILASFLSAGIWLAADLISGHKYSHILIPFWNAITRLGYFTLHTSLLTVLLRALEQVKDSSLKDTLTGIANWKFFVEIATKELSNARRYSQPITIAYIDLDNFKNINDTFGHDTGNDLLRIIANIIQSNIRPGDIVARVGGDEFSLLFSNTNYNEAKIVLNRLFEK